MELRSWVVPALLGGIGLLAPLASPFAPAGVHASQASAAQSPVTVRARLSTGVARLGSDVSLVVEAEGSQDAVLGELPKVDGLRFGAVGAPGVSVFTHFERGRRTTVVKQSWVVPIAAERAGNYTIPPIPVTASGRSFATPELALKVVPDLEGEELGWFKIDAPREVVEGQPFTIDLRFGYDSALGDINAQINYVNLSLPWLDQLPGLLELDAPAPASAGAWVKGVVLNSRGTTNAERLPPESANGRSFLQMRIRKRYLATRAGTLEFPTSHLEFGQVERGFFDMGNEKRTFFKRVPAFTIEVLELPEQGRPLDFTGAVGSLFANATVDRRDVDAGDSIKVSVEWTGEGNLEFFDPPDPSRLEAFRDFRLYGTNDRKNPDRRVVTYDLAPISPEIHAIPKIPLTVFDPAKKSYVEISTDPIPIRVRPLKKTSGLTAEAAQSDPGLDIRDIQTEPARGSESSGPGGGAIAAAFLALPVLWLSVRTAVRRRGDPDAPYARARRTAPKALRRELTRAQNASGQARALQKFLAARTGESEQAWVGRDPIEWARERSPSTAPVSSVGPTRAHGDEARPRVRLSDVDARALAALLAKLDEHAWARGDRALEAAEIDRAAQSLVKGGL